MAPPAARGMTPLPAALGGQGLWAWRLDMDIHAASWDSGEGAFRVGGRWNSKGIRAVYCALDPATAILEVAVHKGFRTLDTVPHVLTALAVDAIGSVHVLPPDAVPDARWLHPGLPGADQQAFGDKLLAAHDFIILPSVVSSHSWNLIFDSARAAGSYRRQKQGAFVLDPRLHGGR